MDERYQQSVALQQCNTREKVEKSNIDDSLDAVRTTATAGCRFSTT